MQKEEFGELIKEKDARALISLYYYGHSKNRILNPDFSQLIIDELSSRELNNDDESDLAILISTAKESEKNSDDSKFSKLEIEKIMLSSRYEMAADRNLSLQNLSGGLRILSYFVVFVLLATIIYAFMMKQVLIGALTLLNGAIAVVLLMVISKLIYVFMDIEYNTRKD